MRNYLFRDKIIQNVKAKFRRKFKFNNYFQKSQIYRRVLKCQSILSVNNLNKKMDFFDIVAGVLQGDTLSS